MSNFKGKRMVSEDLIEKLETLQPGGGGEYTAGTGIEISAQNEISIDTDTVATKSELFSGDYDDLTNKPDLSVYAESANLATVATTGAYSDLSGTPTLATVATTGDYDDLINKPTIPDAVSGTNDGTNWTNITIGSDTYGIPSGGSATTKIVGYVPEDIYTFYTSTYTIAQLITLGVPVIVSNSSNYPVNANINVGEMFILNGFALIVEGTSTDKFMLIGSLSSSNISASNIAARYTQCYLSATGTVTIFTSVFDGLVNNNSFESGDIVCYRVDGASQQPDNIYPVNLKNYFTISLSATGWTKYSDVKLQDPYHSLVGTTNISSGPKLSQTGRYGANYKNTDLSITSPMVEGNYVNVLDISQNLTTNTPDIVAKYELLSSLISVSTDTLTFTYSDNTTGTLTVVTDVTVS